MTLLTLFYEYLLTGLFAVGGGLATLPFLTRMCENHPDWFSMTELTNMVAVSESTPGPLGVNMSTFVGYTVGGVPGAVVSTFALILPSVIIVLIISKFLSRYMENKYVQSVFSGLRPAVTGLIAAAAWTVIKTALFRFFPTALSDIPSSVDVYAVILFFVVLILNQIKPLSKIHPVVYILASAAVSVILKL
ncbi:MAG: chromate transporter [Clostridiales bacterium]|nr:chromate transporter [Clostridiales bacterium]